MYDDDDDGVPAFGLFDSETDDFMLIEGRYRFYWQKIDAERMLLAIADPRYTVVKTRLRRPA